MSNLAVAENQVGEYVGLPEVVRKEVRFWQELFEKIPAKCNLQAACHGIANELRRPGFSAANIRRKYYAWIKAGRSWKIFINRAKVPEEKIKLPYEFVEWFRGLCEQNQRGSAWAIREVKRLWQIGEPIPGYAIHPPACARTGLPHGWHERNLYRHLPSKFELKARRIGRGAARDLSPLVFTTRVGLSVGQYYVFDDLEHDLKVNFIGVNRRAMRPLELAALDLYSGCKFAWGMKPIVEDEMTLKKEKLKMAEMRFLLAHVLLNVGYHPAGTTLIVEHATAAIPEDLEKILAECSGGMVRVQRGGIEGASAFAGAFAGRSKGNFRMKAALESHHALSHTELAALPGQMGANSRLNAPEELHGRERENDALINAMLALPDADRAALIHLPFLEFNHFNRIVSRVYEAINRRDSHDLEGWLEAGLVAYEFAVGMQKVRKQSPREVFDTGFPALKRLPDYCIPLILGEAGQQERRLGNNGLFEFEDQEMGAGEYRYDARARAANGEIITLRDGEKYMTQVNPFDPRTLFVCDARGAYIGACARWNKISRADDEALRRQMGEASHALNERLAPLAARGREMVRQRIADTRHNAAVLGGVPITPVEKSRARNLRNFKNDSAQLLETETVADSDEPATVSHNNHEQSFSPDQLL